MAETKEEVLKKRRLELRKKALQDAQEADEPQFNADGTPSRGEYSEPEAKAMQKVVRTLDYPRAAISYPLIAKGLEAVTGEPVFDSEEYSNIVGKSPLDDRAAGAPSMSEMLERANVLRDNPYYARSLLGIVGDTFSDPLGIATGAGVRAAGGKIGPWMQRFAFRKADQEAARAGAKVVPSQVVVDKLGLSGWTNSSINKKLKDAAGKQIERQGEVLDSITAPIDADAMVRRLQAQANRAKSLRTKSGDREAELFSTDMDFDRWGETPGSPEQWQWSTTDGPQPASGYTPAQIESGVAQAQLNSGVRELENALPALNTPRNPGGWETLGKENSSRAWSQGDGPVFEGVKVADARPGRKALSPRLVNENKGRYATEVDFGKIAQKELGEQAVSKAKHKITADALEQAAQSTSPQVLNNLLDVNENLHGLINAQSAQKGVVASELGRPLVTPIDMGLSFLNPAATGGKKLGDILLRQGMLSGGGKAVTDLSKSKALSTAVGQGPWKGLKSLVEDRNEKKRKAWEYNEDEEE